MEEAVQSASPAAQAGHCAHYERRRPEETVLYQLVQEQENRGQRKTGVRTQFMLILAETVF
jgi:hypothetical protein